MRKGFIKIIVLVLIGFSFISCKTKSDDPKEVYYLWSGVEPGNEVKVINGNYQQSPHFFKEYEMYLELTTSKRWIDGFISINNLVLNTNETTNLPDDSPAWFIPKVGYKVYVPREHSQGSLYFIDEKNNHILFYEIQF
jgi:hypothetical protein